MILNLCIYVELLFQFFCCWFVSVLLFWPNVLSATEKNSLTERESMHVGLCECVCDWVLGAGSREEALDEIIYCIRLKVAESYGIYGPSFTALCFTQYLSSFLRRADR